MELQIGGYELHKIHTFIKKRLGETRHYDKDGVTITVAATDTMGNSVGVYNPNKYTIRVREDVEGLLLEGVLVHELTHYVQHNYDRFIMLNQDVEDMVWTWCQEEHIPYYIRLSEIDARFADAYYTYIQCFYNPHVVDSLSSQIFVFDEGCDIAMYYETYLKAILATEYICKDFARHLLDAMNKEYIKA